LPKERRDRYEITAEILKSALAGALKTQIKRKAGLTYIQFETYITKPVEEGLLECSTVKEPKRTKLIFKTTKEGEHFVENFDLLKKLSQH